LIDEATLKPHFNMKPNYQLLLSLCFCASNVFGQSITIKNTKTNQIKTFPSGKLITIFAVDTTQNKPIFPKIEVVGRVDRITADSVFLTAIKTENQGNSKEIYRLHRVTARYSSIGFPYAVAKKDILGVGKAKNRKVHKVLGVALLFGGLVSAGTSLAVKDKSPDL
jgi:hypothetical protein